MCREKTGTSGVHVGTDMRLEKERSSRPKLLLWYERAK